MTSLFKKYDDHEYQKNEKRKKGNNQKVKANWRTVLAIKKEVNGHE